DSTSWTSLISSGIGAVPGTRSETETRVMMSASIYRSNARRAQAGSEEPRAVSAERSTETARGQGLLEERREEALYAVAEGHCAVSRVLPCRPRGRLGGPAGLLDLLAGVLGALDNGAADTLRGLLHAGADLAVADPLRALFHPARFRPDLRIVGGERWARRG